MLSSIDVVMVDKDNKVLYVYIELKPWRVILPKKDVKHIYELPFGSVKKYNIKINKKIEE
jgi:uncharacterized membrane protein (UPF0127 family)